MDCEIVWSPEAIEDLESIAEYISRDSEFYAKAVVLKILEVVREMKDFPLRGRVVPELGNEKIRECFVYSYRIVYRVAGPTILVAAVIHGKRQFERMSERFKEPV